MTLAFTLLWREKTGDGVIDGIATGVSRLPNKQKVHARAARLFGS
jgi:hypothetical protein